MFYIDTRILQFLSIKNQRVTTQKITKIVVYVRWCIFYKLKESKVSEQPKGERIYKVFHCHGCQSCFSLDDNDNLVQYQHILSSEDITDRIEKTKSDQISDFNELCKIYSELKELWSTPDMMSKSADSIIKLQSFLDKKRVKLFETLS